MSRDEADRLNRDLVDRARRAQQAVDDILGRAAREKPSTGRTAPLVVGIGGLMGHGKDAFADILVAEHGFAKTFMSEPLTNALQKIGREGPWVRLDHDVRGYGATVFPAGSFKRYTDLLFHEGYTAAKEHRDVREYLQGLGTEVGRKMFSETVWTDKAMETLQRFRAAGSPSVITGIRYPNELEMIHALGGVTVWVNRPVLPTPDGIIAALDEAIERPEATHSSETSLGEGDFDYTVHNTGTLQDLSALAAEFVRATTPGKG